MWFYAKFPDISAPLDSIIGDPSIADSCVPSKSCSSASLGWKPPPEEFFKINVDGAVVKDWKKGGIGGVIRDSNGLLVGSFSNPVGPGPPILAELLAIKAGLEFFVESECVSKGRPILESDSQVAVNWIQNITTCPSLFGAIVKEIIHIVQERVVLVKFISRSANWEADAQAKAGIG